jgi:Ca2+/H+ antiporter
MAALIALWWPDGRSNSYKGVQLIAINAIIALMFYFMPAGA